MSYTKRDFNYKDMLPNIDSDICSLLDSRAKFAREFGFNEANLSRVMSGKQEMSLGTFIRIAVALGYGDYDSFYMGVDDEKQRKFLDAMPLSCYFKINQSKISQVFMSFY